MKDKKYRIFSEIFPNMIYSETHYRMQDFWSRWEGQYINTPEHNSRMMECVGICDKKGKEIYEMDILHIIHKIGENPNQYFDGYYKVNILTCRGLELSFLKLSSEDPNNQFPIHQTLSFDNRNIDYDYRNQNFNHIAIKDTFDEHVGSRKRWKVNHYSNDIEVIGDIYNMVGFIEFSDLSY